MLGATIEQMQRRTVLKAAIVGLALLVAPVASGLCGTLRAAELVMFEHAGCPWCQMWHREIGPIYPKTDEGKQAPLRRITLAPAMKLDFVLREPVVATPTFVLVENGKEVGRLTGYRDDESFWGLLGVLLKQLPPAS